MEVCKRVPVSNFDASVYHYICYILYMLSSTMSSLKHRDSRALLGCLGMPIKAFLF